MIRVFCIFLFFALPAISAPRLNDAPVMIYYPTTVGDRWVTETKYSDRMETLTEIVTALEKKDGAMIVTVCKESDGKVQPAKSEMKVTDEGLFRMSAYGAVFEKPYPILKMPLKVGLTWTVEASGSTLKYKVAKEEEIEVPAGKFKTFRLDVNLGENSLASIWYAPRVGVVRQEYKSNNLDYVKTLKEFKPGK